MKNKLSLSVIPSNPSAVIHGGTYPYTYEWTGPDGFTSSQEDLCQFGPGEYRLIVTDVNGCSLDEMVFK